MSLNRALNALICLGAIIPLFHLTQSNQSLLTQAATALPIATPTSGWNCSAPVLQSQASPNPDFLRSLSTEMGIGQTPPIQSCAAQSLHFPDLDLLAAYTSLGVWLD